MSSVSIKRKESIFICLIFVLNVISTVSEESRNCLNEPNIFSKTLLSLSSRLINEIDENDNFIISPLSISAALGMIYIGADGLTKTQISNALHFNLLNPSDILEGFRTLFSSLEKENDIISLSLANSLFIQRGYHISQIYKRKVLEYFEAEIIYVDFANEEQISMNTINQWISNKTNSHMKKLLNEPLDPMTLMVLTNVIYFKGLWEHPFYELWNSFFHKSNGTSKIVPFMKQEEYFGYFYDNELNYSFLEMDYMGGNISMLLILPKNMREIPNFQLTSICRIRSKLEMRRVMVGLPRFQLEYRRELSEDMRKFGMVKLFSDRADLTKIREQNDLHVSLMLHKVMIEVDNEGSRASAISGIGIDSRKRPTHEETFWANHPFLFYIIDKRTETVLFAGRVTDP
ncbi:intracellular coagulation inhibitor 3 [Parasteatoda tepidariorum]|uniref:intracellular coagulation inhibitor 3 n=1 Tax=Parasteatoda tepidariorum TaxID=114398 RepID=UPI00077FD942|nr:intracellular coagulation inhibitor 3 [Parasteatoda tepidariorum]XP_015919342.1 intracellular coagulation inhibitor 3 [Parasteatoda tepidariorum]XP_015919344.2 intracellular coagulation inhibitor 3 [Parasteatoda tepidariorum]XP_042912658.1 intracellular coagulation inhibitor 3 [Parasteatoda tepidariorum]XP_042912668.1 intracellular coagulation inhibitor 3 [Parasteatoda tepidariorum]XP_042912683.1 intracellular coagulation inhibitor 3 [Parasteatoda tepidariorum]XP_042912689.1 intracellular 